MKTTMSTKGQIVLPAELRVQDGLEPGGEFEIARLGPGQYRLSLKAPPPNSGLVDWLLDCPEKGFFEPISSASTDAVEPPTF